MDYSVLAHIYNRLEGTAKRLEMTDILVELFGRTPPDLLDKVVYLTRGDIYPPFDEGKLGLAEKLVVRAIAMTAGYREEGVGEKLMETGDLGTVAEEFMEKKMQTTLFSTNLDVERVYGNFVRISRASGKGSQDLKIKLVADMLHDATPVEAKYITRTLVGKLRLGIADMTILDALATAFATKEERDTIESIYSKHPDLGQIAVALAKNGMDGLGGFKIKVGIPVRVMLAERLSSMKEIMEKMGGRCALDHKYDGIRVQAHLRREGDEVDVKLYSRRMDDMTPQFPDIADMLRDRFVCKQAIVEGECVPIDINTGEMLPFQMVSHRRGRKYGITEAIEDYPVSLFLFDALYRDGEDLTVMPYPKRREGLEKMFDYQERLSMSTQIITDDAGKGKKFFDKALGQGCEGIIAKAVGPDSVYRAGSRGFLWIKLKKDYKSEMTDTVDLVVVGGFAGKGRRAGKYGSLLMAAYNPEDDTFETVCKVASGFTDEFMDRLPAMLDHNKLDKTGTRVNSKMEAEFWFEPDVVLEVIGAEMSHSPVHTCAYGVLKKGAGLAIRFPRFTGRVRDDKGPGDATTTPELVKMYRAQLKTV